MALSRKLFPLLTQVAHLRNSNSPSNTLSIAEAKEVAQQYQNNLRQQDVIHVDQALEALGTPTAEFIHDSANNVYLYHFNEKKEIIDLIILYDRFSREARDVILYLHYLHVDSDHAMFTANIRNLIDAYVAKDPEERQVVTYTQLQKKLDTPNVRIITKNYDDLLYGVYNTDRKSESQYRLSLIDSQLVGITIDLDVDSKHRNTFNLSPVEIKAMLVENKPTLDSLRKEYNEPDSYYYDFSNNELTYEWESKVDKYIRAINFTEHFDTHATKLNFKPASDVVSL